MKQTDLDMVSTFAFWAGILAFFTASPATAAALFAFVAALECRAARKGIESD